MWNCLVENKRSARDDLSLVVVRCKAHHPPKVMITEIKWLERPRNEAQNNWQIEKE